MKTIPPNYFSNTNVVTVDNKSFLTRLLLFIGTMLKTIFYDTSDYIPILQIILFIFSVFIINDSFYQSSLPRFNDTIRRTCVDLLPVTQKLIHSGLPKSSITVRFVISSVYPIKLYSNINHLPFIPLLYALHLTLIAVVFRFNNLENAFINMIITALIEMLSKRKKILIGDKRRTNHNYSDSKDLAYHCR